MAAVLSILVDDPDAADGQPAVFTMHLRPALPSADVIATAAHLAVVAHQLTRTGAPLIPLPDGNVRSQFDPGFTVMPPPPAESPLAEPAGRGRARGKA